MTYLVAGSDTVDAGKTTFAVGLTHRLSTTAFKPRAGNDYWFDHTDCVRALGDGRLYGKDAKRLAAASATGTSPEQINPIHRLWQPAPRGDPFIGPDDRSFLLDRVGTDYVVNSNADLPSAVRDRLDLSGARRVATLEDLNQVTRETHLPRLRELADRIAETTSAVVESYGDVARPLQDLDVDRVAVVEPRRARVYKGDRYWKACEVATGDPGDGQLEEHVPDVVRLLDPVATVSLPPLDNETRRDPASVAEAYAAAYDALDA